MENKKIIAARCALSLTAIIAMLSFAVPTLTIKPANECDACKDVIKDLRLQNEVKQRVHIAIWGDNEA